MVSILLVSLLISLADLSKKLVERTNSQFLTDQPRNCIALFTSLDFLETFLTGSKDHRFIFVFVVCLFKGQKSEFCVNIHLRVGALIFTYVM